MPEKSRWAGFFIGVAGRYALLLVALGGCCLPVRAQTDSLSAARTSPRPGPATVLTLTGGLGAPYGCGVDLGRRVGQHLEATIGAGYDLLSGYKAGVGARYYLLEEHRVATFVGANLVYSGGRADVTVRTDENHGNGADETARVRIRSGVVARLRAGARWQTSQRVSLLTALGHGLFFGSDPIQYLSSATPSDGLRDVVNTRRPDSLELSLAVSVRLGP